jgi:NAD(P)-dependent dehydrogenase (short-subunit alcohol dehydrogenase family)
MSDRVAVVTGGGRGIGAAVARRLAAEGWAVVVADSGATVDGSGYDPDPAEAVAGQIWRDGGSARPVVADVTSQAGIDFILESALTMGPPTALVHAAGTVMGAPVADLSDDAWRSVMAVHLDAAFTAARAFWPLLESCGRGRIVLVGGAEGLVGQAGQANYAAAKAGQLGLMRVLALEGAPHGLTANLVLPCAETRLRVSGAGLEAYHQGVSGARAEDVAPLVAWLCSDTGAGVTGQVFGVRGAELTIWSQPRPVSRVVAPGGWAQQVLLTLTHPSQRPHLVALDQETDVFAGPPIPVRHPTGIGLDEADQEPADPGQLVLLDAAAIDPPAAQDQPAEAAAGAGDPSPAPATVTGSRLPEPWGGPDPVPATGRPDEPPEPPPPAASDDGPTSPMQPGSAGQPAGGHDGQAPSLPQPPAGAGQPGDDPDQPGDRDWVVALDALAEPEASAFFTAEQDRRRARS